MSSEPCTVISDTGSNFSSKPKIDEILKLEKLAIDNEPHCLTHENNGNKLPNGKIKHKHENGYLIHSQKNAVEVHNRCPCSAGGDSPTVNVTLDNSELSFNQTSIENQNTEKDEKSSTEDIVQGISYIVYQSELQMPDIMKLITKDLSEPYSIYTYRYFIHNWPKLCFLAMDEDKCVGAIVCKLDMHKKMVRRGYIAMLAIDSDYRRRKIGSHLVLKAIKAMIADDCDEVVLETEITNKAALKLYENLGFVRDKRLFRYYLNGVDALRLKLWLR